MYPLIICFRTFQQPTAWLLPGGNGKQVYLCKTRLQKHPVCLQTIKDPPVFLCANGHELCQKCREPLKAEGKPCPVCQGELTDVRSRAVEKMLQKLPKTSQNWFWFCFFYLCCSSAISNNDSYNWDSFHPPWPLADRRTSLEKPQHRWSKFVGKQKLRNPRRPV